MPILETERLRLEPIAEADADAMFPLMGDPQVMAFWDSPEIDDPEIVADIVRAQAAETMAGKSYYWAMRALGDGQFIGACDLSEIDIRHRRAEVGFMLGRDAWGRGYALEAMRAGCWPAPTWATAAPKPCSKSSASRRRACCAAMFCATANGATVACSACCSKAPG
jgi:hypothetical protein